MAVAPAALPDLNALDPAALKALIVAQHDNLIAQHEALVSRETEVENLKTAHPEAAADAVRT